MVFISLALATICFSSNIVPDNSIYTCYPALIGNKTPTGEFPLVYGTTEDPGYGGSVLAFYEDDTVVYAVHQLWLLKPEQRREKRIKSANPKDRVITAGCINVTPDVYEKLVDCCSTDILTVTE